MYLTTTDGLRLAWDDAGTGPPVLLVHGLGLSRRRWQRQVDALAAAGYRAVRFDLRGFGDSDAPRAPYEISTLVDDLRAVIDELGLRNVHLVAHSLGGMIAQRFALDAPESVRTLTLASTTAHNGARASAFALAMARLTEVGFDAAVEDPLVRPVMERMLAEAFPAGPPPFESFRRGLEKPNLGHSYAWGATAGFSVLDALPRLACPLLVLHGTADPLVPFTLGERIHSLVAHSRFVSLDGAGHSVQVERASAFNAALLEFLSCA
jgi:3-oxoadipate enol-lactonase